MLEAFAKDPRSQVVVGVENSVTRLDVDIWVDEGEYANDPCGTIRLVGQDGACLGADGKTRA